MSRRAVARGPGVRYYDKMTIDFTQCHCNSHVVLQYRTVGSGKYIAGGWDAISGRFPGGLSAAQHGASVTTSVVTAGASAGRKAPVAPELVSKDGRYRVVWGVRPAGRFTIYSGPSVYLLGTRWASWTAATARATGELWGLDAKLMNLGHASIVLSAPKSHDGLVYYSALRIIGGKERRPLLALVLERSRDRLDPCHLARQDKDARRRRRRACAVSARPRPGRRAKPAAWPAVCRHASRQPRHIWLYW